MTNENEDFSVITKEENHQNLDVFTMANVTNYQLENAFYTIVSLFECGGLGNKIVAQPASYVHSQRPRGYQSTQDGPKWR